MTNECHDVTCTDYDPCPACLAEARAAGLFPVAELSEMADLAYAAEPDGRVHTAGPPCGNNPNYRMSDEDREAVEKFKAYLQRRRAGGPPER